MKTLTQIENDIINHLLDQLDDLIDTYKDDLHHNSFNADYFITGYYSAERWLKDNDIYTFDGIKYCQEMEEENFGEIQTIFNDPETLVNHYAYWKGQELIYSLNCFNDLNDTLTKEDIQKIKDEIWAYYKLPF
tara:strand:- start:1433 stop:1831 length:399 start_codon:yes stop_codon:yes gene_type:complete